MPRILLADDDELSRALLEAHLAREAWSIVSAVDGESAWEAFEAEAFDLVITDLRMPRLDGLGLLHRIRSPAARDPRTPVFVVSAFGGFSAGAAAAKAGATACFTRDPDEISELLARAKQILDAERPELPEALVGTSPGIAAARERLLAIAELDTPVLVSGEPGAGQERAVAYLHALSRFAAEPLHRVDCGGDSPMPSLVQHGTIHLAEVHELSVHEQSAWRERIVQLQLGRGAAPLRIVASTTRDLRVLAAQSAFSLDLARELCRFEVWLPPLRERRDDLPKLIQQMVARLGERVGRPGIQVCAAAIERLAARGWWENFSELEGVLESLVAFAPGLEIGEAQAELIILDSYRAIRAARERARREREQLAALLEECGGNLTHIAAHLRVDRGTIRYRLRKHGLLTRRARS